MLWGDHKIGGRGRGVENGVEANWGDVMELHAILGVHAGGDWGVGENDAMGPAKNELGDAVVLGGPNTLILDLFNEAPRRSDIGRPGEVEEERGGGWEHRARQIRGLA